LVSALLDPEDGASPEANMTNLTGSPPTPKGIVTAMVTPFDREERIDHGMWRVLLNTLIDAGVNGLFVAGGQGEFVSLDEEERGDAMSFCKREVGSRVPLYANVGCITTRATVKLARVAEGEGVDFLVVITPFYLKPTPEELAAPYIEVCRSVRSPVLAYNTPERTGIELTPEILARIASECDNFVGLKDSGGNLAVVPKFMEAGGERKLAVLMGRDHMILPALKLGCAGAVTACSNVTPRLFVDLYRAFQQGNLEEAARLQDLVNPLRLAFGLHTFPSVVKEAMGMAGLPVGPCRRPVGPMPPEARTALAGVLDRLREGNYLLEA
jgi:4-hydroxy-tetrahydrodipicolinate synthase